MAVRDPSSLHPREKIMKTGNKSSKKVFLVAQELKLARVLAGNNKASRDRALKNIKKWFQHRSKTLPFTDNDLQRIWKGLYFSMWMSDKPLIQEQCAEDIASLINFETFDESLLFFKAGLTILINEWFGIDQLRLDKFLMLVRRLLRHMLLALKQHGLSKKNVNKFGEVISFTILNTDIHPPLGLFMHFTEIYLEEIAKVTKGNMPSDRLIDFIQPFIKKLTTTKDSRETSHIKKCIFTHLIKQSKLGMEYQDKYDAWKNAGFPGTIDKMQKIKLNNEKATSKDEHTDKAKDGPLDPRAGRVDVELPQIKFKAKDVVNTLLEYKFDKNSNAKSRQAITELVNNFTKLSQGVYPLGAKKVLDAENSYDTNVRKAANRLIKFEKKLLGKEKKKRKISNENSDEKVDIPQKRKKVEQSDKVTSDKNDVTEEQLEKFIAQSEGSLTESSKKKKSSDKQINEANSVKDVKSLDKNEKNVKRKLKDELSSDKKQAKRKRKVGKRPIEEIIDNIECVFERNSGTWVVYDTRTEVEVPSQKTETQGEQSPAKCKSPSTSSKNPENLESATGTDKSPSTVGADLGSPNSDVTPTKTKTSPSKSPTAEPGSPKSGLSPVRLFESPQKTADIFPKSSWDEPLQEGEYEICIPAKKHVAKLKRKARRSNQDVHELINTSMKQLRGKGRLSLDAGLIKNPFSTPSSAKKVKINTRLNMSQEIHEHVRQILSSPGIPYDANKKPLKPLLKASASSTPVNPFYNKQLNVW